MANPWITELWRLIGIIMLALIIGAISGQMVGIVFLALLGYIAWHGYQLYQLDHWFKQQNGAPPPVAEGIWGEIFNHIYRLQQRNEQRKNKLKKMISRFQKSTSAMPDATVVLNNHFEIEWFNKAARKLLGLHKRQDIGQRIDNLIRNPLFIDYLRKGNYDERLEFHESNDDDTLLAVRIVPFASTQLLMVIRDESRQQQLERVKRDFVANVSHELRTPLTVISGYLETLLDEDINENSPQSVQLHAVMTQMSQHAARMRRIVEDLLLLSRLESDKDQPKHVPIAIPSLIHTIFEDAQLLGQKHQQTIEVQCDENLWLIGNEKELHSSFSNLVYNAMKYTDEGGHIIIRWQQTPNEACFSVQDNGIGIAAQHIPRLTERFYRVDRARSREQGGTGLGLAIVKHVLNRHQAYLSVKSQPGQGSCFTCHFPIHLAIAQQTTARSLS